MWRLSSITLLCALTTAAPLEAAQSVRVRVVSSADPAEGVRSAILTDGGGAMAVATRTDRTGVATLSVERCDDALGIAADPVLPFLRSGRFDCTGELVIPVGLPDFVAALAPALRDAATAPAPLPEMNEAAMTTLWGSLLDRLGSLLGPMADMDPGPVAPDLGGDDPRAMLRQALAAQDDARTAQAAAALAAGDPALADSYKALAATAAFRAIGLEAGDPERPLMTPEGDGVATTEAGQAAITAFQQQAGVAATGAWTPETLARLPSR